MRHIEWRRLVIRNLIVVIMVAAAQVASAETRPQYGGVLHIAMRAAPASLDPADGLLDNAAPDSFGRRSLAMLMFDTLVTTDENGRVQASLATTWRVLPGSQHWQIQIRRGVTFHDGTPLTAEAVAASLHAANPSWNVSADGDSVTIEWDNSSPDLLQELALPRNAIARRTSGSNPSGTGPFHIVDWQPGKKLALAANEDCWRGRPFLDPIEIEMGKTFHDQITELELGNADLVEVAPDQAHRAQQKGRSLASSMPVELLALFFSRDAASPEEKVLRQALALSVERRSIRRVLLQGVGQPAASILPDWMSGYAFVFSTDADLPRARQALAQVHRVPTWTLAYDATNPLARLLAERISLNAKDAGLALQPTASTTADLRLMQVPLVSPDPWIALGNVAALAGLPIGKSQGTVEDLYSSELALLATQRVIPLFHLPVSYSAATTVKNWTLRADGTWTVADAWLENAKQ
jgi:peptide/nickel transport system substrate-binding protein